MKNNARKQRKQIYCFAKEEPNFEPICINGVDTERVKVAKLLGVMVIGRSHISASRRRMESASSFCRLARMRRPSLFGRYICDIIRKKIKYLDE